MNKVAGLRGSVQPGERGKKGERGKGIKYTVAVVGGDDRNEDRGNVEKKLEETRRNPALSFVPSGPDAHPATPCIHRTPCLPAIKIKFQ